MAEDGENANKQDVEEKENEIRATIDFSDAGDHGDTLREMYNEILQTKKKSGEIQSLDDELTLANEMKEVYYQMAALAVSPEAIDLAMQKFQNAESYNMENAMRYALEAKLHIQRQEHEDKSDNKKEASIVGTIAAVAALSKTDEKPKVANQYERIKRNWNKNAIGDYMSEKSIDEVDNFQKANPDKATKMKAIFTGLSKTAVFEKTGHLAQGGNTRATLAYMMGMAAMGDTKEINDILIDIAKHQGFDEILVSSENGEITGINREKLEELFNKRAKEGNPKFKGMTMKDFEKINEKSAERLEKSGKSIQNMSTRDIMKQSSKEAKRNAVFAVVRNATRVEDFEEVETIFRENPEEAKELLKYTVGLIQDTKDQRKDSSYLEKQLGTWNEIQKKLNEERQNDTQEQNRNNQDNNHQRRPQGDDDGWEH